MGLPARGNCCSACKLPNPNTVAEPQHKMGYQQSAANKEPASQSLLDLKHVEVAQGSQRNSVAQFQFAIHWLVPNPPSSHHGSNDRSSGTTFTPLAPSKCCLNCKLHAATDQFIQKRFSNLALRQDLCCILFPCRPCCNSHPHVCDSRGKNVLPVAT